jgi:hypothetical protein
MLNYISRKKNLDSCQRDPYGATISFQDDFMTSNPDKSYFNLFESKNEVPTFSTKLL